MTVERLDDLTLDSIRAESIRASVKHPGQTNLDPEVPWGRKLATIGEEFGEVCELLTYDKRGDDTDAWKVKLIRELLQLSSTAASWAQCLDRYGHRE